MASCGEGEATVKKLRRRRKKHCGEPKTSVSPAPIRRGLI